MSHNSAPLRVQLLQVDARVALFLLQFLLQKQKQRITSESRRPGQKMDIALSRARQCLHPPHVHSVPDSFSLSPSLPLSLSYVDTEALSQSLFPRLSRQSSSWSGTYLEKLCSHGSTGDGLLPLGQRLLHTDTQTCVDGWKRVCDEETGSNSSRLGQRQAFRQLRSCEEERGIMRKRQGIWET